MNSSFLVSYLEESKKHQFKPQNIKRDFNPLSSWHSSGFGIHNVQPDKKNY